MRSLHKELKKPQVKPLHSKYQVLKPQKGFLGYSLMQEKQYQFHRLIEQNEN